MAAIPHKNDVLFGRGRTNDAHPGNGQFRSLVEAQKQTFKQETVRKKKRSIATTILQTVHDLQPPGRFLEEDPSGSSPGSAGEGDNADINPVILAKAWKIVADDKALPKILHCLREKRRGTKTTPKSKSNPSKNQEPLLAEKPKTDHDVDHGKLLTHEYTMHQWMETFKSKLGSQPPGHSLSYVISALPIALKLTECLLDEGQWDDGNPIPLASVRAKNVLIRAREGQMEPASSSTGEECQEVIVEYVWIMSSIGDSPDAGAVSSRLFALGGVLYELFSCEEPLLDDAQLSLDPSSSSFSVQSISLNNEAHEGICQRKKSLRQMSHSDDWISKCIALLETKGIPWPLRAILRNLFDCSKGDFCGDEAYTSLAELHTDLKLMNDQPLRFLHNIQTSPIPSLTFCDKICGLEDEITNLEHAYQQHINGHCSGGAIIRGGAGTGKSLLAMHVQELTTQHGGHFVISKFDQNKDVTPLSTVGNMFNSLCDLFEQDASPAQLKAVEEALESVLGDQASLLASTIPSLTKILPSCILNQTSSNCIDSAVSMRYLFGELLQVLSSHGGRSISLVLDDIQWSDQISLLLIGNLICNAERSKSSIFFTFCHRDDDASMSVPFKAWLSSLSIFSLVEIQLDNMTPESINILISETLHLSPRLTRPLSSTLHHKPRGNPLFLRQLMSSLNEQGYLYVELSQPRWAWDLNKITEMELSDSVLALLTTEMKKLPPDLQLALKISSLIGSRVKYEVVEILAEDLKMDLKAILQQISQIGFMNDNAGSATFHFVHDKIQQAAYELMPEQERRRHQMSFGLALCSHTMGSHGGAGVTDELFFLSINLINRGGAEMVYEPSQKSLIASLNLRAGEQAIGLSDCNTAFQLFEHGISFLGGDHWTTNYKLSIELFEAAAESASLLNKSAEVKLYSENVFSNARCFDDRVNCLYSIAKVLRNAEQLTDSMEATIELLVSLGEDLPREMGDHQLAIDIQHMNTTLQHTSDDSIFNMEETKDKKSVTVQKIYADFVHLVHFAKPSLVGSSSLRMVDLTMKAGLSAASPLAFAYYGEVTTASGNLAEGCRLGRLALKLLDKKSSSTHKSSVIFTVYQTILWASEPLQSFADAHYLGKRTGQQFGDFIGTKMNWLSAITTSFVAGQNLGVVFESNLEQMQNQNSHAFGGSSIFLHHQVLVLKEGKQVLNAEQTNNIPSEKEALQLFKSNQVVLLVSKIYSLVRAFLFRNLDDLSPDTTDIWGETCEKKHVLWPLLLFGVFFEGLASFSLARQRSQEATMWIQKGEAVLENMKNWSKQSFWNWGHKMYLLEAEKMHTFGNVDEALSLYISSIVTAREHKFIHDEAIASELAGLFYHEIGLYENAATLLLHSAQCYSTWGAMAVAQRVEVFLAINYGPDYMQTVPNKDTMGNLLTLNEDSSKKRRRRG